MKIVELKPILEGKGIYEEIELKLKRFFRQTIYAPILKELGLPQKVVTNALPDPLVDALFTGRIIYTNGHFSGTFNSQISKILKSLGAVFKRSTGTYYLPESSLPSEVKAVVGASHAQFQEKMQKLDQRISELVPKALSQEFKCEKIFDQALFKADRQFSKNVKKITVSPHLTDEQRERIAKEWQNNMNLYIKDWTESQIKELRAKIAEDVLAGARKESFIPPILKITKTIQSSHDHAVNKAKFLAHQETRIFMSVFKQTKYEAAGIREYIWRCVHRPHDTSPNQHTPGNVRYSHGKLEGKIFRFDDPPVTTNPGESSRRNNPGQDYNCRCFARPILRVKR